MTRILVERVIPAVPERRELRVVSVTCDLCGRTDGDLDTFDGSVNWPAPRWTHNTVTLTHEESVKHSDGGYGTIKSLDCCPTCFLEKIVPLFTRVDVGGELHSREIDY